jgi:uncharacterized membrane protein YidH (DUF202 family)
MSEIKYRGFTEWLRSVGWLTLFGAAIAAIGLFIAAQPEESYGDVNMAMVWYGVALFVVGGLGSTAWMAIARIVHRLDQIAERDDD